MLSDEIKALQPPRDDMDSINAASQSLYALGFNRCKSITAGMVADLEAEVARMQGELAAAERQIGGYERQIYARRHDCARVEA